MLHSWWDLGALDAFSERLGCKIGALYIILYPKHHIDPYNPKVTVSVVRYHRAHHKSPVEILVLRFERSFRFDRTRWRDHYVGGI